MAKKMRVTRHSAGWSTLPCIDCKEGRHALPLGVRRCLFWLIINSTACSLAVWRLVNNIAASIAGPEKTASLI